MLKRILPWLFVGLPPLVSSQIVVAHPDDVSPAAPLFECIDGENRVAGPSENRAVPQGCDSLEPPSFAQTGAGEAQGAAWPLHPELFRRELDPIAHVRDSILESRELAKQSLLSTHEGLFNDAKSVPVAVASAMTSERGVEKAVADTIAAWVEAWSNRNVESYLSFYGPAFTTGDPGFSFLVWSEMRRDRLRKPRWISVKVRAVQIAMNGSDEATVSFQQDYRSPVLSEITNKTLVLKRQLDKWQIYSEITR